MDVSKMYPEWTDSGSAADVLLRQEPDEDEDEAEDDGNGNEDDADVEGYDGYSE